MFALDKSGTIKLVQVTDTHLFADSSKELMGINTYASMSRVLELVCKHQDIDAMLLSGDISQDDSLASYQIFQQSLLPFDCPKFWYKGNHDSQDVFNAFASEQGYDEYLIRTPHWQIILLDTHVEGTVFGYLTKEQLDRLESALVERPDLHTFISFHHQPIPMGSTWIDRIGLKNAEAFHAIIQRFNNVRAVLWGHVHQESDRMLAGVRYLSTPSTCVQFKPQSEGFAVDQAAPGYRWLLLHADGTIETEVERVAEGEFLPDETLGGY